MPLTRDQILGNTDLNTDLVQAPRWGGEVLVREMPMASPAYVAFLNSQKDKRFVVHTPQGPQIVAQEFNIRRHLGAVILSALDPETRQPLFRWADADELREKHWNTVLAIATRAYELSGGDGPEDIDAAGHFDAIISYAVENSWSSDEVAVLAALRSKVNITEPDDPDDIVEAEIVEEEPDPLAETPGRDEEQ